jgi:hypothetical protein
MSTFRAVAIGGPKYCGKDTACKYLLDLTGSDDPELGGFARYKFVRHIMAGGVKSICTEMFGYPPELMENPALKEQPTSFYPFIAPRWPMMDIANWLREKYGGDVHARRWERLAHILHADGPRKVCLVQPDLRFPEELEMHQRLGSLIVYVERDSAEQSLTAKQLAGDEMALNQSEIHHAAIKAAAHVVLRNEEGQPHVLRNGIITAVRNHYGYWKHWE